MTALTAVGCDGGSLRRRPGILAHPVPDGGGRVVNRPGPRIETVTIQAQRCPRIVLHQKTAKAVVMRVVTGGALNLLVAI